MAALGMLYLLLGVASVGVALKTRARPYCQLRLQVYAWWWILPVLTLGLVSYPLGPILLVLLIGMLGMRELAQLIQPVSSGFQWTAVAVLVTVVSLTVLKIRLLFIFLPALLVLPLPCFFLCRQAVRLVWLLLLLTCYGASFLVRYIDLPFSAQINLAWLCYLFAVTALNDVGQFIFGTVFGRHRIAPSISPNKTWQGLADGIAVSIGTSLALGAYLQLADLARLAAYAVLLSLGGFCGDLVFSAAKRSFGIKDFSRLIPGHGGMLDRADSLIVTAPLLYFLICFSQEGSIQ